MNGFWQIVVSNAMVATLLALGVALIGRVWKNPQGRHLLWLLVLVKLLTPPVFTIPVVWPVADPPAIETTAEKVATGDPAPEGVSPPGDGQAQLAQTDAPPRRAGFARTTAWDRVSPVMTWLYGLSWLDLAAWAWGVGSVAMALYYGRSSWAFIGCSVLPSRPSRCWWKWRRRLPGKLGLRRTPEVVTLDVRVSPLVFGIGGRPRIVLPAELCERLDAEALRTILVHEMADLRRGDHLIRLLELVATALFWWHPVAWWASRQLRELEELCCDAVVLGSVPVGSKVYATAILDTLDFIVERPTVATLGPTMVRRSSSLVRRIRMLQTYSPGGRLRLRHLLSMAALMAFPLAVSIATSAPSSEDLADNGRTSVSFETTAFADAAGENDEMITFQDPLGDDNGPGTYTYPTDPVYTRGSFDLSKFSVTKMGDRVRFDVTVAAPLADPWRMRAGFSVQMVFIFIQTDNHLGGGFTDTVPGLNVTFAPADAWNKLIILSPQPAARIEGEIEAEGAGGRTVVDHRARPGQRDRSYDLGHHRSGTIGRRRPEPMGLSGGDAVERRFSGRLGFADPQGESGGKAASLRRRRRCGLRSAGDRHSGRKGRGGRRRGGAQHEMLRYECDLDGSIKQGAVLKMVRK